MVGIQVLRLQLVDLAILNRPRTGYVFRVGHRGTARWKPASPHEAAVENNRATDLAERSAAEKSDFLDP
jgi:hypothetical protein